MENIKLKKSNSSNIASLIIFIIFFTAIFPFVETLKDKSNKKRLLKREVNAVSGLIEKKCLKKKYNSECVKIILANYIESRERLFDDIDNYIDLSKIIIIENEFPKNIGVNENNRFKKNYSLPFHKYYKFMGIKTFLETYSTSSVIHDNKNGKYNFVLGTMNQLKLTKSIIIKSVSYLIILLVVVIIYIKFFKDRIDCPFFYEFREKVTTRYLIFLICISSLLLISKDLFDPYEIKNVYPWIKMKMNPYKIYEFIYYTICLFGFLLFYIFREHIKRTKSYPNTIRNYGVKLLKSDKKNEK